MPTGQTPSEQAPNRDELNEVLRQFEQAWLNDDTPPDVRRTFDANASLSVTLLKQLVVLNYDLAWDAFRNNLPDAPHPAPEPNPVRVYRRAFPETEDDDELLFELLFLEITNWENPDEEYYVEKYPQLADALRSVFELLKLFRPEQLRSWAGSVSKMARAQVDDSHSILLDTKADSSERSLPSVDTGGEDETTEPQPPLEDGATLELADSCRIAGETIGVGAFKRVYQGYQASTGRAVAVKQLVRLTRQGVRNFVSEGRAQAGLDHQNIPPVMLLGDQDGQPALLLEKLIRAPDWSTIIRDAKQRQRNLDILLTVSRAAEYAHRECHLVHRDIKPQNVLVGEYREVYLVDWGLAVQVGDEPVLDDSVRQLRHEPDGYIIGPPAYMAPEMAMGRNQKCTPATDVFLLGAILYEILSGHPPYDAYPRAACMRAAAHLFPDLPDDVPEELKAITLQAMARDPADRFVDAGEFGDALDRYLSHQEAENQSNRAESAFRSLREELNRPPAQRRDAPALLTSLIADADQYRQAGVLWESSGETGEEQNAADASRGESTEAPSTEPAAKLDEFTAAGIERSRRGECEAREQLVSFAIESGDLALAQSQAEVLGELNSPRADELQTSVSRAQERRQRDRRQRLTAAAAALILLIASLAFWQQRTSADARAEKAESDRVAAESKQQLAEAETQKKAAQVRAAQAETKAAQEETRRQEAERLAAGERADRERERAQLAESQRLFNQAITAITDDFNQASVLYRAASLEQIPIADRDSVGRLLDFRQSALSPHRTSSRRIMTESVLLSPNSRWLVSADLLRASIRVWSAESWAERFVLEGHQKPDDRGGLWGTVRGFAFDPRDADVLYSAGMDGTLRAWNLATREELRRFEPEHDDDGKKPAGHELMSLSVRPADDDEDSVQLIVGKRSGELFVLDADSLKVTRTVKAHDAEVIAVSFSPDGMRLASAASDGSLMVWNSDFEELASLTHPEQPDGGDPVPLFDVAWRPDGKLLATSGGAVTIPVWETDGWTLVRSLAGHPDSVDGSKRVRKLLWLKNDLLLSGGADGVIRRWNPQTGEAAGELTGHTPNMYGRRGILSLSIDPRDPNRLISSGRDDSIRVWNLADGKMTHALEGADIADPLHLVPMPIHSAYVAATDQLLTTMPSYDAPARLWNAETLREVQRFPEFPDLGEDDTDRRVQGLAISPDGQRFVTSELNGNLIFWSAAEPAPLKVVKGHQVGAGAAGPPPSTLIPMAFSLGGKQVVSLSSDGKMRVWNSETFEQIREWATDDPDSPPEIPGFLKSMPENYREAFMMRLRSRSMDNTIIFAGENRILTAGRDGLVRFWNVESGKIVRRLEHVHRISSASLDTTGTLLAMGTVSGDVQIHDISNPDRDRVVYAASFDPIMDVSRFGRPLRVAESRRSFAEDFQRRWAMHVHSVAFSPGNDLLAVTLGDGSLTLIQIETGDIVGRGIGHVSATGFMQSVETVFTKNGRLLTIGDDHAVRQWDFNPWKSGRIELPNSATYGGGWKLEAAPGGNGWIYLAGKELVRWRSEDDQEPVTWQIEKDLVRKVVSIPDSEDVLLGTHFGRAIRFSRTDNQPVLTFAGQDGQREFTRGVGGAKVAVSSDGRLAASSWMNSQIDIWNLTDGSAVRTIPGTQQPDTERAVEAVALHPDGTQLAVTDFIGTLRVWDLTQPDRDEPLFERTGPQQAAGLEYTPDGSRLVQAGLEQNSEIIVVWETTRFEKVTSLRGHRPVGVFGGGRVAQVLDLDISPDGQWLATCGSDATVRIWKLSLDSENWRQDDYEPFVVLSTLDLAGAIRLKPDPDGAADPGNVRTWLTSVAFQTDSRKLAVCGNAGPVYVFDIAQIQRETQRPADELYERVEEEMGIRLENDRPVPRESLRLMPVKTED